MSGSSRITKPITTNIGVTPGWPELRLLNAAAHSLIQSQIFRHTPGGNTATAYFRPQLPHELEFATHRSIEDVIGTADYVSAVNEFYRTFDWFVPINVDQVHSEIGNRSLGKYLKDLFAERFERSLDKIGVAIHIAQAMSNLAPDALARLQTLVDQLCRSAAAV